MQESPKVARKRIDGEIHATYQVRDRRKGESKDLSVIERLELGGFSMLLGYQSDS